MNKRNSIIGAVGLAAILTLGAADVFARGGCGGGGLGGFMGARVMRMAQRLDLNKSQREQIWQVLDAVRVQARESMEIVYENRKGLTALTKSETFDSQKARQFAQAQADAMADLMVIKSATRARIRAVLTPEQKAKFDAMRERGGKRGHHRLGRLDRSGKSRV